MKIRPLGAELFHADGQTDRQTDMTKLTVVFRNFSKAPTNRVLPRSVLTFCTVRTVNNDFFPQLCILRTGTEFAVLFR